MNTAAKPSTPPRLRRNPGLPEIQALLEALPQATFLVEAESRLVAFANASAAGLSGYSRAELAGKSLEQLIQPWDDERFFTEEAVSPGLELALVCRNQAQVSILLQRSELHPQSAWLLVHMEATSKARLRQRRESQDAAVLAAARVFSQSLHSLGQSLDLDKAITDLLHVAVHYLGGALASIYLSELSPDKTSFQLHRAYQAGNGEILPETLAHQGQAHLAAPSYWGQGMRSASALHRAARSAGLHYLATAPLGGALDRIGFLACAGDLPPQSSPELIQQGMFVFANLASALIQLTARLDNLGASLLERERRSASYQNIATGVNQAIVLLDEALLVAWLNPAAEQIFGYSNAEAANHPVENILIGSDTLVAFLQKVNQDQSALNNAEARLYRRSGQPFLAEVKAFPAQADKASSGVVVLVRDLSEREQIQAQAKQLEQRALLGEVTAVFAHEVRNPINNISTGLQLMAFNLPPDDPNQENIARLQHDCDRLSELMKSVLAFSRPMDYEMEDVDLALLLNRLVERQRPNMVRANVQPVLQIDASLPPVWGNPRALEQVFTNLAANALQAMSVQGGGSLAIKTQPANGPGGRRFVQVDFADNGPGIPKELQDRLFQPFFTTRQDGTGLGLAITKRIITAHKGAITVTSFPGGSVFHVQIPVSEAQ
ncbi:MAG: PAS domain S-box protein [Chloroflexi bacterium]|nr:PAS domain S-box protein [Chloroflexota bacterium]